MVSADELRDALHGGWHCRPTALAPLAAGLASTSWAVSTADTEYVATLADLRRRAPFEAALVITEHLAGQGVAAGMPVRTTSGQHCLPVEGGVLALVRRVPGRPLDPLDPLDQQWWGDLLGAAHRSLDGFHHPGLLSWHWLRPDAPHLDVEPWLRPAVRGAVAAVTKLTVTDRLTYGVLHGDPAAGSFLIDVATGRTGLTHWGATAGTGPLAYDVAGAVACAGGLDVAQELLDGYAHSGPVPRDELDAVLPVMLRFRWAAHADWYAARVAHGGSDADHAALQAAHAALTP